jgi:hypothetical protein
VSPNHSLMTKTGAAVAHIALVHSDGRLQPLPLPNAGLTVQDLERLAATFNARLLSNSAASPGDESTPSNPPLATNDPSSINLDNERTPLKPPSAASAEHAPLKPQLARDDPSSPSAKHTSLKPPTGPPEASMALLENDTRLPAVVDLDTAAVTDPSGSSLPFFQSSWLRTVCRTPALLATIPGLVSRRVTVATSGDELHLSIEPQRGMRPVYAIIWIATVYVCMVSFSIVVEVIIALFIVLNGEGQQDIEKHKDLFVAISAAIRSVAYATYILGLHVLGAPRLVSITIRRDEWTATTALRMFLGRHVWKKSFSGRTQHLGGCQVCLSRASSLVGGSSLFSRVPPAWQGLTVRHFLACD